jgi:hypothetical protein
MERIETIQRLLAIKDTVYGLLEWAESVSDEEFEQCCTLQCGLPEEVLERMETFCRLAGELGGEFAGIVEGLNRLCAGGAVERAGRKE